MVGNDLGEKGPGKKTGEENNAVEKMSGKRSGFEDRWLKSKGKVSFILFDNPLCLSLSQIEFVLCTEPRSVGYGSG